MWVSHGTYKKSPLHKTCARVMAYVTYHEWSGEGLQHLLGATKRAFSVIWFRLFNLGIFDFSKIFWNSDYRQRFPLKSTDIWRYRIQLSAYQVSTSNFKLFSLHPWWIGHYIIWERVMAHIKRALFTRRVPASWHIYHINRSLYHIWTSHGTHKKSRVHKTCARQSHVVGWLRLVGSLKW